MLRNHRNEFLIAFLKRSQCAAQGIKSGKATYQMVLVNNAIDFCFPVFELHVIYSPCSCFFPVPNRC